MFYNIAPNRNVLFIREFTDSDVNPTPPGTPVPPINPPEEGNPPPTDFFPLDKEKTVNFLDYNHGFGFHSGYVNALAYNIKDVERFNFEVYIDSVLGQKLINDNKLEDDIKKSIDIINTAQNNTTVINGVEYILVDSENVLNFVSGINEFTLSDIDAAVDGVLKKIPPPETPGFNVYDIDDIDWND